jgi:hypothetical protein
MATIYSSMSDADLAAEIAAFTAARRAIILGGAGGVGSVKRITDGDRTLEYTSANIDALNRELSALLAEQARREGRSSGRAIEVEFD